MPRFALPVFPLQLGLIALSALLASCGAPVGAPPAPTDGTSTAEASTDGGQAMSALAVTGRTYYVDCWNGNDGNRGTSTGSAWKSVGKVNNAWLNAGDGVLFRRGCTWTGPLNARWNGTSSNPVTIGAYGSGELPKIRNGNPGAVSIRGSYQVIDSLQVTADKPGWRDTGRCYGPVGWRIGFSFTGSANHNTVRNSKAYGMTGGVHIEAGASYNKVLDSQLYDNTVMSRNDNDHGDNDSGAWGILLNGSHNEIGRDTFWGNTACSEDYGVEGASLELYGASHNWIHHNTSVNDTTFSELGGTSSDRSEYNTYEYNTYAPLNTHGRGEGLVVRGWGSSWGANPGTVFNHNTIFNSNLGVFCGDGCSSSILSMHGNIIVTRGDATKDTLWADHAFDEGGNVYYQLDGQHKVTVQGSHMSSSSTWGNPGLQDPWNKNFNLQSWAPKWSAGASPRN